MNRFIGFGSFICLTLIPVSLVAQDSISRTDVEKRAIKIIEDTVAIGAKIFNDEDNKEGCYRLYQGTLLSIASFLDHKPKIVELINGKMAKARTQSSPSDRAFTLREALDETYLALSKKPLWERLGGEKAVRAVVHEFVVLAANDPKVNFFRDGKYKFDAKDVEKLEQLLVELISAVGEGPLKYTGRDMKSSHRGMKITNAEFDAIAADLIATLKKFNVPEKEINELVGIVATTRKDIVESPLWDRLGGEKAVRAVVHDFVLAAATNPKVNFFRDGKYKFDAKDVEKLEQLLVELISATTGGPLKYTGRDMKSSHKGMKITDGEFDAIAGDLIATLKKYKVPQQEIDELVGIVASTRKDIVETEAPKEKALWERLGGEKAVRAVIHDFVLAAAGDPKVNFLRDGKFKLTEKDVEKLEQLLVELVSATTGGPLKYTGRDMKTAHKGMKITDGEFDALAGHLIATLKKYNVPRAEIDELVAIVASTRKDIVEKE